MLNSESAMQPACRMQMVPCTLQLSWKRAQLGIAGGETTAQLPQSDSVMSEAEQKPVASVKDVRGLCTKRIALQAMGAMYLLLNWFSASPLWEVE